jgi:hypothetical protein
MTLDEMATVLHVAPAEHNADVAVSAAQAMLMTLCRPTPPRVTALDVLVPVVQVAPAEHHADVEVSQADVAGSAGDADDDAMPANANSRDDTGLMCW